MPAVGLLSLWLFCHPGVSSDWADVLCCPGCGCLSDLWMCSVTFLCVCFTAK